MSTYSLFCIDNLPFPNRTNSNPNIITVRAIFLILSAPQKNKSLAGDAVAKAKGSIKFTTNQLEEMGIHVEKIGSKEVEYKTEDHPEVKAFRAAHEIFMSHHPLPQVATLCQMNADESHLFWYDQSGKTLTTPECTGAQVQRLRGGRYGLTITPVATPTTKGRMQVIVKKKLIGEKRFQAMQGKYSNVLKMVRNESGYQTSASYNDFVKNSVVQLAKTVRQKHPDMTEQTGFEY